MIFRGNLAIIVTLPIFTSLLPIFHLKAQTDRKNNTKDQFDLPGPLTFDSTSYYLAWCAHPTEALYIQEYIPYKQTLSHFEEMMLVQALADTQKIERLVSTQMAILEKRRSIDDIVNYQSFNNRDKSEYILDFVISQGTGSDYTVEWNAYKYQYFNYGSGSKKGVLLTAVSFRAYGQNNHFMDRLAELRKRELLNLVHYKAPSIRLH